METENRTNRNIKEEYMDPELEIVEFEDVDIFTESTPGMGGASDDLDG